MEGGRGGNWQVRDKRSLDATRDVAKHMDGADGARQHQRRCDRTYGTARRRLSEKAEKRRRDARLDPTLNSAELWARPPR